MAQKLVLFLIILLQDHCSYNRKAHRQLFFRHSNYFQVVVLKQMDNFWVAVLKRNINDLRVVLNHIWCLCSDVIDHRRPWVEIYFLRFSFIYKYWLYCYQSLLAQILLFSWVRRKCCSFLLRNNSRSFQEVWFNNFISGLRFCFNDCLHI